MQPIISDTVWSASLIPLPMSWVQLYLYPLLVTVALWGVLTIGLLWLNRRHPHLSRLVLVVLIAMLVFGHQQLWEVRNDVSIMGYYRAFISSMLIWTWHELAFYSGVLAGPWRAACPVNIGEWERLRYAIATHLYHIIAVAIEVIGLWWLHAGAENIIGPLSFTLFWILQLSAKLNVLLGIRNLEISLLPKHLRYLGSFWAKRPHNPFFLPSVLTASIVALALWARASALAPDTRAVGMSLIAGVVTLGALEHWLLILPPKEHRQSVVRSR